MAELAYDQLIDAIRGQRLKPGTRLVPETLAAQLGVSATPVKLALTRLSAEGLVAEVARRGMFVTKPNADQFVALYQARLLLETAAVREYGHRVTPDIVVRLSYLAQEDRRWDADADSVDDAFRRWLDADWEFHRTIIELSGNEHVMHWHERVHIHIRLNRLALPPSRRQEVGRQHLAVAEALGAGNTVRAEQALREHIESGMALAERALREPASEEPVLRPISHVPRGSGHAL